MDELQRSLNSFSYHLFNSLGLVSRDAPKVDPSATLFSRDLENEAKLDAFVELIIGEKNKIENILEELSYKKVEQIHSMNGVEYSQDIKLTEEASQLLDRNQIEFHQSIDGETVFTEKFADSNHKVNNEEQKEDKLEDFNTQILQKISLMDSNLSSVADYLLLIEELKQIELTVNENLKKKIGLFSIFNDKLNKFNMEKNG